MAISQIDAALIQTDERAPGLANWWKSRGCEAGVGKLGHYEECGRACGLVDGLRGQSVGSALCSAALLPALISIPRQVISPHSGRDGDRSRHLRRGSATAPEITMIAPDDV